MSRLHWIRDCLGRHRASSRPRAATVGKAQAGACDAPSRRTSTRSASSASRCRRGTGLPPRESAKSSPRTSRSCGRASGRPPTRARSQAARRPRRSGGRSRYTRPRRRIAHDPADSFTVERLLPADPASRRRWWRRICSEIASASTHSADSSASRPRRSNAAARQMAADSTSTRRRTPAGESLALRFSERLPFDGGNVSAAVGLRSLPPDKTQAQSANQPRPSTRPPTTSESQWRSSTRLAATATAIPTASPISASVSRCWSVLPRMSAARRRTPPRSRSAAREGGPEARGGGSAGRTPPTRSLTPCMRSSIPTIDGEEERQRLAAAGAVEIDRRKHERETDHDWVLPRSVIAWRPLVERDVRWSKPSRQRSCLRSVAPGHCARDRPERRGERRPRAGTRARESAGASGDTAVEPPNEQTAKRGIRRRPRRQRGPSPAPGEPG